MVIKSYLVFPQKGRKMALKQELEKLPWCDVQVAENEDLLIMVAETKDEQDEEIFFGQLNQIKELEHYSLVSGFNEEQ